MTPLNPWKFGAVLSITAAISYVVCALFWYSFPGPSMELLNELFHGMDFRKIYSAAPFSISASIYVLAALAGWAFVVGAIYAAVRNFLLTERTA
jgi:hypothetical protein